MIWIVYMLNTGYVIATSEEEPTVATDEGKAQIEFDFIDGQPLIYFKYDGVNVIECTEDEIEIRSFEVGPGATIEDYKKMKYCQIDERTSQLISLGYSYGGELFSLSMNAQTNILALDHSRLELSYPIEYNTKNDESVYSIADATTVHNMYLTALATKKARLDSGTVFKTQVRDATTIQEVRDVYDNR